MIDNMSIGELTLAKLRINVPTPSGWECRLFGRNSNAIIFYPPVGQVPNIFHRWMQRILLGFYWGKKS